MKIGVELAYGFGDCIFGLPSIKSLAEHHATKVDVAVQAQCADAFHNVSYINKIIHVGGLWDGIRYFQDNDYNAAYQFTPHAKFSSFKDKDPSFSLIDASKCIAEQYGIEVVDQRPLVYLTSEEQQVADDLVSRLPRSRPIVAIESVAKSMQSWADQSAIEKIINHWRDKAHILWLSNTQSPDGAHSLLNYTRRQIIGMLKHVDMFYNVGSGFFCASLASDHQPKKSISLWVDDFYKYEKRLSELAWHKQIVWVHNAVELEAELHVYGEHY